MWSLLLFLIICSNVQSELKRVVIVCLLCLQVLVHGSADATNSLMDYCQKNLHLPRSKLFAPRVGETVDATTESHIYQVRGDHVSVM